MPELGFQTITLDGSGSSYRVGVTPVAGAPLGRPVVSGDGVNMIISFPASAQVSLPVARFNARQPGYIPQATFAPPLQPRAVAPPLGDMAVGSMTLRNPGYLNLSGPAVTMTLKNAPAKDALMALAQVGGYGFAYVAEADAANPAAGGVDAGSTRISLAFRGESYGRAFNTALLAAGLQGRREGNMILAGPKALSKTFGPQLSKVYRLNQVGPNAAADYLANLGATVTKTNTITTSVTQGVAQGEAVSSGANSQTTQSSSITNVEAYGASSGPLLGLRATTDTRLGTITLVGDPVIVSVAEQYLKQLDLRQRQVALSVRILDVNLDNVSEIDNSFAFKWGNNFIVNDSGQLLGAFGQNLPPGEGAFDRQSSGPLESIDRSSSSQSTSSLVVDRSRDLSLTRSQLRDINSELQSATGFKLTEAGERLVVVPVDSSSETLSDSTKRSIERILSRNTGRSVSTSRSSGNVFDRSVSGTVRPNPGSLYSDNTFFDFVRAQIVSGSTKLLASPTLILQENPSLLREGSEAAASSGSSQAASQGITNIGLDSAIGRRRANEGVVRVGTNVVTGYETETPSQGGNVVCTPELSTAGLVLGARVEKIDDNGFVTFVLSPSVSAVTNQEVAPQGCGSNLNILSIRSLDTGALRVRDGQTLIMTGVISEFDRTEVSKWPILGDMPLIGQFFRSSSGRKEKRELVIMVSPRIVNDDQGGVYGYGYQPGTAAGREFFGAMNGPGGN
ncbi:general secretion pathway protein D [Cyanobium sp. Tous-M-B4]|nr:general secretion pathway protein D [Cyanobium sp. Tous-M-B4]MCP9875899.1 general secretion pathway protein D [Cyanobium sp. A2C-AMD]